MKTIRFACLVVTFAVLAYTPSLLASTCCSSFITYCYGLCASHGGAYFWDCNVQPSGSDYCWCNDDPGNPVYGQPSGLCDPF